MLVHPSAADAETTADLVDVNKPDPGPRPEKLGDALSDRLDILRRQSSTPRSPFSSTNAGCIADALPQHEFEHALAEAGLIDV